MFYVTIFIIGFAVGFIAGWLTCDKDLYDDQ